MNTSPKPYGLLKSKGTRFTIWRDRNGFPKRFATHAEALEFALPRLGSGKVADFRVVSKNSVRQTNNP